VPDPSYLALLGSVVALIILTGTWFTLNFATNFHMKQDCTENDTEVLEIIMQDGSDLIWSSCALAMLKHPDRNRAVEFLIERVRLCESGHPPLNYMQALGLAGDPRAEPVAVRSRASSRA
jgi:hypothetical protein